MHLPPWLIGDHSEAEGSAGSIEYSQAGGRRNAVHAAVARGHAFVRVCSWAVSRGGDTYRSRESAPDHGAPSRAGSRTRTPG